jgi:hypothetical protein
MKLELHAPDRDYGACAGKKAIRPSSRRSDDRPRRLGT